MNLIRLAASALFLSASLAVSSGTEWSPIELPGGGDVEALLAEGGLLFAGTGSHGAYLSKDRGGSWTSSGTGLPSGKVQRLARHGSALFAGTRNGLFRSADSGKTWVAKGGTVAAKSIVGLASLGADLYLGPEGGGLFVSRDGGDTWSDLSSGLGSNTAVTSIARMDSVLVVGTTNGPFLSRDRGASWQSITLAGAPLAIIRSAAASGGALFLGTSYKGVYRSADTGKTWSRVANGLADSCINVLLDTDRGLFAGTWIGLYRSLDGGDHWTSIGQNMSSGTAVRSLAVQGTDLFAGTEMDGVFRSPDTGRTWVAANRGFAPVAVTEAFATDSHLFVGTNGSGVFRGDLRGLAWTSVNKGLVGYSSIAAMGSTGQRLLLSDGYGILGSDDNGDHWTTSTGDSADIVAFAGRGARIYAWQHDGHLLVSLDSGRTWSLRKEGAAARQNVHLMAHFDRLYAGTSKEGLLLSPDSGKTWNPVASHSSKTVYGLASLGHLVFSATPEGLFRGAYDGSWTRLRPHTLDTAFQDVAASGTRVFALTYRHVFASGDSGRTWDTLRTAADGAAHLALTVAGPNLLVRAGGVLWSTPLDASTSGIAPRRQNPSEIDLRATVLRRGEGVRYSFDLPRPEHATLRLHDLSGRELATLVDAPLGAGGHAFTWSGARMRGPVVATLRAGDAVERRCLAPRW